jgi:hypothetical protein
MTAHDNELLAMTLCCAAGLGRNHVTPQRSGKPFANHNPQTMSRKS